VGSAMRDRTIIYGRAREDKSRGEKASPRDGNVQLAQMEIREPQFNTARADHREYALGLCGAPPSP